MNIRILRRTPIIVTDRLKSGKNKETIRFKTYKKPFIELEDTQRKLARVE